METIEIQANDIHIFDRSKAELTGVTDVISFSDCNVTLLCKSGTVSVDGSGLKIVSFNSATGELKLTGSVDGILYYDDKAEKRSKRKLFG